MQNFTLWYEPQNQSAFATLCPFVDIQSGIFHSANVDWPNGWYELLQDLNPNQFGQVDTAANELVAIDIKPSPCPPGSPHGR